MAFIIAEPCIDVKDTACLNACPVDCIHPRKDQSDFESARMLYIDPVACIDCGACVPVCPVEAIFAEDDLPYFWDHYVQINAEHYKSGAEKQEPSMLTQIGGKIESDFTQPLGMLSDCHKRIRYFLSALLTTVTHADEGPLTVHQCIYLETALRYFREVAPKHTADEEKSLFPRLRCIDSPEMQATLRKLEDLEADHRKAESQHQETDAILHQWMMEGGISPKAMERLRRILIELLELYERHMLLEETNIFPLAEASLSDAEKSLVGCEMATRRGMESIRSDLGSE